MADAFNHVGIEGALHEVAYRPDGAGLGLKDSDELTPDNFALVFGIARSTKRGEKPVGGTDDPIIETTGPENLVQLRDFVFSHHAVVNKHASESFANGLMRDGGGHHAINSPTERTQHVLSFDRLTNVFNRVFQE